MTEQTLVAVYDTAAHAGDAVRSLQAAGVPQAANSQHSATASTGTAPAPVQEKGFWSSLFGGDTDDADTLHRSVASGSTVVTVKVPGQNAASVSAILEKHNPIDFDERTASYGATQTTTTRTETVAAPLATTSATAAPARAAMSAATTPGDETIKVMEERLAVGKRAVNTGGARVRAYVVETPVEQQVSLHSETVRIERRPVADGRVVTDADFGERSVEMRAVSEEVVVGKEATDRVETVRDTVRSTKVEVEEQPGVETKTATTRVATAQPVPAAPLSPKKV